MGFTYCVMTEKLQHSILKIPRPLARMLYGSISVVYEYGKGLQPMLKAALYMNKVTMLTYAAGLEPELA